MVTENNSQINSFTGGMDTDTSYQMLQDSKYAFAENIRITSLNNPNTTELTNAQGEVRPIEGVAECFDGDIEVQKILATASIRQYGIVIYTAFNTDVLEYTWRVGRFINTPTLDGRKEHQRVQKIEGFKEIFDSKKKAEVDRFSIVTRYEDQDIIKLYIADSVDPLVVLNIHPSQDAYNATVPFEEVLIYPEVSYTPPEFVEFTEGQLKASLVQYSYRLYNKNGVSTDISPQTRLIPIVEAPNSAKGKDINGYQYEEISTNGVKIKIKESDTMNYLNRIMIFRISYVQNGQLPTVEIIEDTRLNRLQNEDGYYYYTDKGSTNLDTLTLEEYNNMSGIHIIPKVLESKDDYMYAGNVRTISSWTSDEDLSKIEITPYFVKIRLIGDGVFNYDQDEGYNSNPYAYVQKDEVVRFDNHSGTYDTKYFDAKIYSTTIDSESGGKVIYVNRELQPGTAAYDKLTNKINDYLSDYATKHGGPMSYANPVATYYCKSLRRGEVYRYGIICYNKFGEASYVKHIGDFEVPNMYDERFKTFSLEKVRLSGWSHTDPIANNLYVFPLGLVFDVKKLPKGTVSYEIVRCNRTESDVRTITQGVISRPCCQAALKEKNRKSAEYTEGGQTINNTDWTSQTLTPLPYLTTSDYVALDSFGDGNEHPWQSNTDASCVFRWASNEENHNVFQLVSPEISYMNEYMRAIVKKQTTKLQKLKYICPRTVYAASSRVNDTWYHVDSNHPDIIDSHTHYSYQSQGVCGFSNFYFLKQSKFGMASVGNSVTYFCKEGGISTREVSGIIDNTLLGEANYTNDVLGGDGIASEYDFPSREEGWPGKANQYALIKLYLQDLVQMENPGYSYEVNDFVFPDNLEWTDMYNTPNQNSIQLPYLKGETAIGSRTYNNTIITTLYNDSWRQILNDTGDGAEDYETFKGFAGHSLILELNGVKSTDQIARTVDVPSGQTVTDVLPIFAGTFICNLQRQVTPYNGISDLSIRNSSYYSYGDFFNKEDEDNIAVVFDGDTFIMPFEYLHCRKYYFAEGRNQTGCSMTTIYSIPVETSINLAYTSGEEFSKNQDKKGIENLQLEPGRVYDVFTQKKPAYVYNSAYSSNSSSRVFSGSVAEADSNDLLNTDYRVYCSLRKDNKSSIDNWSKFQAANFLDLDSRYGEITNLRTFKDELLFWQLGAFGKISSNERSVVTDNNNTQLMLGVGGPLDKAFYYDTTSGMAKEQYCDTASNIALYWFDDHNQELKQYAQGGGVKQLSKIGKVQSAMHEYSDVNKIPTMFFDDKYNEVISNVLKDRQMVFSEYGNQFTSTYTLHYSDSITFDDKTYLIANNLGKLQIGQWNAYNKEYDDFPFDGNDKPVLHALLRYVVNKSALITKVFDNQEIVTVNQPYKNDVQNSGLEDNSRQPYFKTDHEYQWTSDLRHSESDDLDMTYREGNYRYAIPRQNNADYGDRMRGKYLICDIKSINPDHDASISYILTKFRASWS